MTLLFIKPGQTEVFLIAALTQQGRKELTHRTNSQGRLRWVYHLLWKQTVLLVSQQQAECAASDTSYLLPLGLIWLPEPFVWLHQSCDFWDVWPLHNIRVQERLIMFIIYHRLFSARLVVESVPEYFSFYLDYPELFSAWHLAHILSFSSSLCSCSHRWFSGLRARTSTAACSVDPNPAYDCLYCSSAQ